MTVSHPSAGDDYVARMFKAIERGDMETLRTCFAPGARVWHNDDEMEQDLEAVCGILSHLRASATRLEYEERRVASIENVRFVQHVLTASLSSGGELRLPAMLRIELEADGRVSRIEEYYDSRALDCLAA